VVGRKATHRFHILRGIGEDTPEVSAAESGPTSYEIRTLDVVPAPRRVAESLQLPTEARVILLERVTRHDDQALALWTTYLPYTLADATVGTSWVCPKEAHSCSSVACCT
jgi:DNA-binding GntR family transcriptional regulator